MFTSRTHARLAACAALVTLGLAAAPAARAQSLKLNSGDAVTVSSAGTVGTIGGNTVANPTTSYRDTSSTFYAVQTNGTAAFTLGTGGSITGSSQTYGLQASGSGPITISGGSISVGQFSIGLYAPGSSPVTITGGTFTAGNSGKGLTARGSGSVTISGGTFTAGSGGYGLATQDSGSIDLYGMFDGFATGNTNLLSSGATGSFVGTLTNNTASQLFTYQNSGTITLHNAGIAAAPEPSQFAAFGIGMLGLGALALRARKRQAA